MVAASPASNKSLEALRITRPKEKARRKRKPGVLLAMIILATAIGATTAYEVYLRTVGRPQTVQTIMVLWYRSGQPGVMLTGSGYVVTRHKYITIGTKILGQIVAEPIEEGQHARIGDLLAKIDDRDYQAQNQAGCRSPRSFRVQHPVGSGQSRACAISNGNGHHFQRWL